MFRRSWVRIPAPDTGHNMFSHIFAVRIVIFVSKEYIEAEDGPFLKKGGAIKV